MERKYFLRNRKKQLVVVSLILFLSVAFTVGIFTPQATASAYANEASISFDDQLSGSLAEYSLEEIKSMLGANNRQLYQGPPCLTPYILPLVIEIEHFEGCSLHDELIN